MAYEPTLLIEVPQEGVLERALEAEPLLAIARGEAVVEPGPTDAEGNLEAPAAGEVVLSVPSPEALARQAADVRRVIEHAGTGIEPLVVEVEVAEQLTENELAAVLEAARHSRRAVILRIIRGE